MTPERLVNLIPSAIGILSPPETNFSPADPIALCRWINRYTCPESAAAPAAPLGPLWPQAPRIHANHYSLAQAPGYKKLFDGDGGPLQLCNKPGVNRSGQPLPAGDLCRKVAGHVIASNGEVAFARTDFAIPGPFPFRWQRFYRRDSGDDCGLGPGWRHSLSEALHIYSGAGESTPRVELHTAEGRIVSFTLPAIGHRSYNRFERLLLHRQSLHSYRISGFDCADKIFRADGASSALPLTELRDSFGNSLTVDYREGRPQKIVSSWGRVVEFEYSGNRLLRLLNRQAPSDSQTLCEYLYDDEAQFLTGAAVGPGRESYRYCERGLAGIDGDGTIEFSYDGQGRCHRVRRNQLLFNLSWRGAQRHCTLHCEGRHPIQWQFSEFGQLLSERQGERSQRYLYDLYGNLCQVVDAEGRRTIFRHDEFGRLLRRTRNGISDRYLYDERGLLLATQQQGAQNWKFSYCERGLPLRITDPENRQWQCQYSDRGQLLQLTDPEGGRVEFSWDSQCQLQSVQRSDRRFELEYNHWQQPTACCVDGETHRQWLYGPRGELRETRVGDERLRLDYDANGHPCALRAGDRALLQWQRGEAGAVTQIAFADGRAWEIRRDAHGQISEFVGDGQRICWRYDAYGRISSSGDPQGRSRQWHYHPDGRVREYRDNDTHWYFHYCEAGLLRQIRNNSGQQCDFHYDRQRRLVQADNLYSSVRFQYDRRGLLIAEHHDCKETGNLSLNHRYDGRGWLKSSSSDSLDLTYLLAPDGGLYGLDANGEPALRCEAQADGETWIQGRARSRLHRRHGRLTAVETQWDLRWQFEPQSALSAFAPPAAQRLLGAEILCDKRGNIVRETRPGARRREYLYQYDGWGLMTSAECGDFKTYFRYDPFGRRLSKLSTHRKSTRRRRVDSHWYAVGLWCERALVNDDAQPAVHYLHHPNRHTLLGRWREGILEHYLLGPDAAPLALFDHGGALLWHSDPAGDAKYQGVSWRGRGQQEDSETGLHYSWRGYWNPHLDSWMHWEDPLCPRR